MSVFFLPAAAIKGMLAIAEDELPASLLHLALVGREIHINKQPAHCVFIFINHDTCSGAIAVDLIASKGGGV